MPIGYFSFFYSIKNIINEWTQKKWNRIKETKQKERVIVLILESACLTSWLHDGSLFLDPKVVSCPYLSPVKKWNKTKVLRNFQLTYYFYLFILVRLRTRKVDSEEACLDLEATEQK